MRWLRGWWMVGVCGACLVVGSARNAAQGLVQGVGPAGARTELGRRIAAMVAEPAVARAHWGVVVTAMDGVPIYQLNAGQFFQPASNAKLFTTAAAMALLGPERRFETKVVAIGTFASPDTLTGDLYLVGDGDANLSGREIPYVGPGAKAKPAVPAADPLRYLAELADQVAATGLKTVKGNLIADDTLFPYEPYPEDWAIDDKAWGYGAPVSALTINDNQIKVTIAPGRTPGLPGVVTTEPPVPQSQVRVGARTMGADTATDIHVSLDEDTKTISVGGVIAANAAPDVEEVAILNPVGFAAKTFREMLAARGVMVDKEGQQHKFATYAKSFLDQSHEPILKLTIGEANNPLPRSQICTEAKDCPDLEMKVLARHQSPRLAEDVVVTNKVSQNLHAELLLHQLGEVYGYGGSTAQGVRVVRQFLVNAGVDGDDFVFYDGSGLSGHDLVTPRAVARLLRFAAEQPWFRAWKASLPVGGVDGSLAGRFTEAPLKGHVFAKTGTLGEARALSGYLECRSGRMVIFSILVGNHAPETGADREVMDRMVAAIAAAN